MSAQGIHTSVAVIENEFKKLTAEIETLESSLAESHARLSAQERQLDVLFEMSRAGICITGADSWTISSANARLAEMFLSTPAELVGETIAELAHPSEVDFIHGCMAMVTDEIEYIESKHRFTRKDGTDFWGLFTARRIVGDNGRLQEVAVFIYDITEQRNAEDALNKVESNYWEIFNATNDALFVHDAYSAAILDVNTSVERMFGFSREEILFMNVHDISQGEPPYSLNEAVELIRMAVEEGPQRCEWRCRKKNGELFWAEISLTASHIGGEGRVLAVFRDITDRKEIEQRLQYLSAHDALTGLFNQSYFDTEFNRLIRGRHYPISLVIADLDGLKTVNDTFGHAIGDQLIKGAADVLRSAFRAEDLIARIGGDEYAVLLPQADEQFVATALERIREEERDYNRDIGNSQVHLSLGGATANTPDAADTLFRDADSRMYANKSARKCAGSLERLPKIGVTAAEAP